MIWSLDPTIRPCLRSSHLSSWRTNLYIYIFVLPDRLDRQTSTASIPIPLYELNIPNMTWWRIRHCQWLYFEHFPPSPSPILHSPRSPCKIPLPFSDPVEEPWVTWYIKNFSDWLNGHRRLECLFLDRPFQYVCYIRHRNVSLVGIDISGWIYNRTLSYDIFLIRALMWLCIVWHVWRHSELVIVVRHLQIRRFLYAVHVVTPWWTLCCAVCVLRALYYVHLDLSPFVRPVAVHADVSLMIWCSSQPFIPNSRCRLSSGCTPFDSSEPFRTSSVPDCVQCVFQPDSSEDCVFHFELSLYM